MDLTRAIATKVLKTVDAGLSKGLGKPRPGMMCVEAAVCYAIGLPHGDEPTCVSRGLRQLKINLNDRDWSSKQARAKGLRRLALAQLGSADVLDEREFARRVSEYTIRVMVPIALRAAASMTGDIQHHDNLLTAADRCEKEGTGTSALEARTAAYAASDAAYAASYAASAAASASAATAAAYAASAYAASDAAYAAYAAAVAADAYQKNKERDRIFSEFAEGVVQILLAMNAPGCQWLDLAPLAAAA